ncbi:MULTISPECIES: hypothetical protein [Rhizobium]|uniref:Uncharacterized protein n=3 Tax=Rhizobium TaxID=379 RepID=A0AAX2QC64_9HYPH|nr:MULTISPECIES: hypothetical protein [Rhizobium]MBB3166623.1 hypothetical protein [Rhizobium laguerreae]MBY3044282.1 hypothetical protein [Rhizobium leguminosarum]MBY3314570.1 hypothetical protein [Rhizobium laguerreae]MBY3381744.1 hypothetical protein [Rhizobium laguerreae]MBY5325283.1 hypothetical protein [Rhizobium leguminosarum]
MSFRLGPTPASSPHLPPMNYCFIVRNDNTIDGVGFAAIRNPGGLTACQ